MTLYIVCVVFFVNITKSLVVCVSHTCTLRIVIKLFAQLVHVCTCIIIVNSIHHGWHVILALHPWCNCLVASIDVYTLAKQFMASNYKVQRCMQGYIYPTAFNWKSPW